jgi:hypothetical protein
MVVKQHCREKYTHYLTTKVYDFLLNWVRNIVNYDLALFNSQLKTISITKEY